ncbi:MAG TPA: hypothetical protein VGF67_29460, partial [Ktedonobacteraceae bacterium]
AEGTDPLRILQVRILQVVIGLAGYDLSSDAGRDVFDIKGHDISEASNGLRDLACADSTDSHAHRGALAVST